MLLIICSHLTRIVVITCFHNTTSLSLQCVYVQIFSILYISGDKALFFYIQVFILFFSDRSVYSMLCSWITKSFLLAVLFRYIFYSSHLFKIAYGNIAFPYDIPTIYCFSYCIIKIHFLNYQLRGKNRMFKYNILLAIWCSKISYNDTAGSDNKMPYPRLNQILINKKMKHRAYAFHLHTECL